MGGICQGIRGAASAPPETATEGTREDSTAGTSSPAPSAAGGRGWTLWVRTVSALEAGDRFVRGVSEQAALTGRLTTGERCHAQMLRWQAAGLPSHIPGARAAPVPMVVPQPPSALLSTCGERASAELTGSGAGTSACPGDTLLMGGPGCGGMRAASGTFPPHAPFSCFAFAGCSSVGAAGWGSFVCGERMTGPQPCRLTRRSRPVRGIGNV